jgi:hypothetical protein
LHPYKRRPPKPSPFLRRRLSARRVQLLRRCSARRTQ